MKTIIIILVATLNYKSYGNVIDYKVLRLNIVNLLRIPNSQEIVFKRLSGQDSHIECEIQIKSTRTATTFDIIFPNNNRSQVSVEFSYSRSITEHIANNYTKYSSNYVACNGDQYDTYRDCWEYDHYEMILKNMPPGIMTLTMRGYSCTVNLQNHAL